MTTTFRQQSPHGGNSVSYAWENLAAGESGDWLHARDFPDKTVQMVGSAGMGVVLEGSNDGGTTVFQLYDYGGNAISMTSSGAMMVRENPSMIRPRNTGSSTVKCYLSCAK